MPVLLLAQGDTTARDHLRKAIEARYGPRPPALDSLRIKFKGRSYVKMGPLHAWVPLAVVTQFRFPTAMRWDYTFKPLKLPVQRGIEIVNEVEYHSKRSDKAPTVVTDESEVSSMRRRLWAMAAVLLTPLSDYTVTLATTGEHSFLATNTALNDEVEIYVREDHSLDYVSAHCLNAETGTEQLFTVKVSEELVTINDLIVPRYLTMTWDNEPSLEAEVVELEANPHLDENVFVLENAR